IAWLAIELASGPRWAADLYTTGAPLQHSEDKLKRAKLKLHAETKRDSIANAWYWHLPQHQGRTPPPSVAPLRPCALETRSSFQGSVSTSKERMSADREKQADTRALETCDLC